MLGCPSDPCPNTKTMSRQLSVGNLEEFWAQQRKEKLKGRLRKTTEKSGANVRTCATPS